MHTFFDHIVWAGPLGYKGESAKVPTPGGRRLSTVGEVYISKEISTYNGVISKRANVI